METGIVEVKGKRKSKTHSKVTPAAGTAAVMIFFPEGIVLWAAETIVADAIKDAVEKK